MKIRSASVEFDSNDAEVENKSTDINPQEINENPGQYARKVAEDRATQYDQMAGFSVPRDYVMLPSKGKNLSSKFFFVQYGRN